MEIFISTFGLTLTHEKATFEKTVLNCFRQCCNLYIQWYHPTKDGDVLSSCRIDRESFKGLLEEESIEAYYITLLDAIDSKRFSERDRHILTWQIAG